MNPIAYALVTYGITAAISLLVVAVVLLVNSVVSRADNKNGQS